MKGAGRGEIVTSSLEDDRHDVDVSRPYLPPTTTALIEVHSSSNPFLSPTSSESSISLACKSYNPVSTTTTFRKTHSDLALVVRVWHESPRNGKQELLAT